MPLILRLIGQFEGHKTYEIKDSFEGHINIKTLFELFTFWELSIDEINKVKFFIDAKQIKNPEENFNIKVDEDKIILVFTSDIEIRNKLFKIFIREGYEKTQSNTNSQPILPDPEICKPITRMSNDFDKSEIINEDIPKLTDELIDLINIKTVSLFADNDFKSLISIYLRRPELFGIMAQYVQNGNVLKESLGPIKTIEDLTDKEIEHYQCLANKINHLELNIPNAVIINKLIKFSGHLNLTLRSLLCDIAKNDLNA